MSSATLNPPVKKAWNEYDAPHKDLRELLARVERSGELARIPGADWNLEVGTLAEIVYNKQKNNPPAILFEDIAGYPDGRLLCGMTNSAKRLALTMGFPVPGSSLDAVRSYRDRMKTHKPVAYPAWRRRNNRPAIPKTAPGLRNRCPRNCGWISP